VRARFEYVIGDVKSLCIHLGQDNKCPCCTIPYERMHCELYGRPPRDADSNKEEWLRSKVSIATLWAMGYASKSFAKFLKSGEHCRTAEQLLAALAGLEGTARLSVTLVELQSVADRLERQPGGLEVWLQRFIEGYAKRFQLAERGEGEGVSGQTDSLKALAEVLSTLEQGSARVREQLVDIETDSLFKSIACLIIPGIGPKTEELQKVRPGDQLKDLWMKAVELSKTASSFGEKLGSFQATLSTATTEKLFGPF
jgi:hypothetical protein